VPEQSSVVENKTMSPSSTSSSILTSLLLPPVSGGCRMKLLLFWLLFLALSSSSAVDKLDAATKNWWKPKASDKLTWQWQLQGKINQSYNVDVYDVDLFDTPTSTIRSLQRKGIKVICYFSAGTYEGWRDDWKQNFNFIKGNQYRYGQNDFSITAQSLCARFASG